MDPIADLRKEYSARQLDEQHVASDPMAQFKAWFDEALSAGLPEPNAMHIATVSAEGSPSGRMVLLKGADTRGFIFYSNYQSRKGRELEENSRCCLTFFWPELERQVRIEGVAHRLSSEESDAYYRSRPRGSQIGAWASPQSSIIATRSILEQRMQELEDRFRDLEILNRPHQWGGYVVAPAAIEFWQGRPSRLHDRLRYKLTGNDWTIDRLAP